MLQFLIRRLAFLIFVIVGITFLIFVISNVIPADPARAAAGPNAMEEQVQALRKLMGLDRPLPEQYLRYLIGLVHGDLGTSVRNHQPIWNELSRFLPATIELTLVAMILYIIVGVPLGVLAAVKQRTWADSLTRFGALAGVAMPEFWLALMLQVIFYRDLGWLPGGGRLESLLPHPARITGMYLVDSALTGNWPAFKGSLMHLILPATALMVGRVAVLVRVTRISMVQVLGEAYVLTARAKGLRASAVVWRHAFKNALIPIITIIGLQIGWLLNGAVLVETVFGWPGIGYYAVQSISFMDFPAVMGVALVVSVLFVFINVVVDLLYMVVDPRVRI